ncbi:chemotaxis protein [Mycobacterium sp. pW049]|uniref:chemotaxis protein n=1 Tax=[Mycobacterium] bulgaricum TaxID=3238985 RepID=UPI00351B2FFA
MPASAAVAAGPGMPTRPYSMRILGGSWPSTSPESWSETANALSKKSADLNMSAAAIRRAADDLGGSNSGQMIDAMCERSYRTAQTVINHSDLYGDMAKAVKETAELIWHARGQLEEIDRKAHEEIERLKQQLQAAALSPLGAGAAMAAIYAAIEAVITAAQAEAQALGVDTASAIAEQAANIGGNPSAQMPGGGQITPADHTTETGSNGDNVQALDNPTGPGTLPSSPGAERPSLDGPVSDQDAASPGGAEPAKDGTPGTDGPGNATDDAGADAGNPLNEAEGVANPTHPQSGTPGAAGDRPGFDSVAPSAMQPPMTPLAAGGSGGGGSSSLGSVGSGFKPPSASGLSSAGTGGLSPSSLSSNAGLSSSLPSSVSPASGGLPSAAAGGGGAPGAASSSDFSRGFSAGLGTGSVLPPPVAPPPAQPLSSTTGASSAPVSVGPAPVSAAGGPAHVASPGPAGSVPAGNMGSMGAPMMPPAAAPAGPLPPFNSDLQPRQVAPAAAGAPPPAPPPAPPASAGQAAALPPGVVASGVGATAAGAVAGARSGAPDPLLDKASALVYELMHASRVYGCIDWCVGMFKTPSGPQAWVVSSEGSGFIPPGVFLPSSARLIFSDPGLDRDFHARWFGWVNPAQTMTAYGQMCMASNPNVELWAVAVSTDYGGNAAVARDAGVRHIENCALATSPIKADSAPPALDETRIHRLETIDRPEYARLTTGGVVDRAQLWALTVAAVRTVLSRASELLGFQVPPAIRQVATSIENGEPVSEELWADLDVAMRAAILDSAGQRPGRVASDVGPSAYARCFHNVARAAELLSWWRSTTPDYVEIAYTARHIAKEAELWPTMAA